MQNCTFADLLRPPLTTDRFDVHRSESGTCWSRTTCPHTSIISAWTPRGRCTVVQDSTIRKFLPNLRSGIGRSHDAKPQHGNFKELASICRWSRSHLQEYTILKHWPWCSHSFGLLTVEHNLVEPARSYIRELLEAHGYLFHSNANVDDWCVEFSSSDDSQDKHMYTLISLDNT